MGFTLKLHMKEWLRPLEIEQAGPRFKGVLQSLDVVSSSDHSCIGYISLNHLTAAATALAEAQKVAMYAQVFAFYLGCVPRMGAPMGMMGREGSSSFFGGHFRDNDPRSLDAE